MGDVSIFTAGDGCRISYRFDGPSDKPVLVLSNSIGTSFDMWDTQIPELSKHFRVLRYDTRGHGGSGAAVGAYSVDRLGWDVTELLDTLKIGRVYFCGLSLGGIVGQWLGVHAPERIIRLILCHTSPYLEHYGDWNGRIAAALLPGNMPEVAETFLRNWFPAAMLYANEETVQKFRSMLLATDPQGLAGCYAAVRDMDMRRQIALISCPTLVIGGLHDTVTLPGHSEQIAATVPGAKLVLLPSVHLSNVEFSEDFMKAVLNFLSAN
jgi:3-oxoadipate enol-lactonase